MYDYSTTKHKKKNDSGPFIVAFGEHEISKWAKISSYMGTLQLHHFVKWIVQLFHRKPKNAKNAIAAHEMHILAGVCGTYFEF